MPLPLCTTAGGLASGMPDVCKTPSPTGPVPMPYPNLGDLTTADDTVDVVLVESKPVIVLTSVVAKSQGDEAGTAGGVVSGTTGDRVTFRQGASKVYAANKQVVLMGAATAHNGSNPNQPMGQVVAPSQGKAFGT